jgi:hypothetical protein
MDGTIGGGAGPAGRLQRSHECGGARGGSGTAPGGCRHRFPWCHPRGRTSRGGPCGYGVREGRGSCRDRWSSRDRWRRDRGFRVRRPRARRCRPAGWLGRGGRDGRCRRRGRRYCQSRSPLQGGPLGRYGRHRAIRYGRCACHWWDWRRRDRRRNRILHGGGSPVRPGRWLHPLERTGASHGLAAGDGPVGSRGEQPVRGGRAS